LNDQDALCTEPLLTALCTMRDVEGKEHRNLKDRSKHLLVIARLRKVDKEYLPNMAWVIAKGVPVKSGLKSSAALTL
jgi:shikimate kinase